MIIKVTHRRVYVLGNGRVGLQELEEIKVKMCFDKYRHVSNSLATKDRGHNITDLQALLQTHCKNGEHSLERPLEGSFRA